MPNGRYAVDDFFTMIHLILFRPEIPQNTGNIGRLCAITGARLHLIHPLGFTLSDKHLKRSGMDYWHALDCHEHPSWEAFEASPRGPQRLWLFTTRATQAHWDVQYQAGDGLLFGNEGSGCPDWLHEKIGIAQRLKIPHFKEGLRSLNLSTAAGVATYEALRQLT